MVKQPKAAALLSQPCIQPDLFVKVGPSGYCGGSNRPAVIIQCDNCQGQSWEFSLEARTEYGQWNPLRVDGKRQQALGVATRTEPLCNIPPGSYYFRVLAWGEHCSSPIIQAIGTAVQIADEAAPVLPGIAETPSPETQRYAHLPDTCIIESEAVLEGNLISGFIELDPASPCSAYKPFAKVRYVHPGYRDISIGQIALRAGEDVPFKVRLDNQDLRRGIHPLQVIVCIRPRGNNEEIPISSFWIRADAESNYTIEETVPDDSWANKDDNLSKWEEEQWAEEKEEKSHSSVYAADPSPIDIFANDAGCDQIQGLQLIYCTRTSRATAIHFLAKPWLLPGW